jgi:AMP nucleosidase
MPLLPEGVKTAEMDQQVTRLWAETHLRIGIEAMTEVGEQGEKIKHFRY